MCFEILNLSSSKSFNLTGAEYKNSENHKESEACVH